MPFVTGIDPVALRLLGVEVRWYGLAVATAVLVAIWIARRGAPRQGLSPESIGAAAIWVGLAALVGARLLYVMQHEFDRLPAQPARLLMVWMGGLSFYGALIGAAIALIVVAHRERLPVLALLDVAAPAAAIGQAIGHLGCLIGGDSAGIPTDVPWAVIYTNPGAMAPLNTPLHPTQAYEAIGLVALFVGLWLGRDRLARAGTGVTAAAYLVGLAVIRFGLFYLRDEPSVLWGLKTAQLIGIGIALGALALLVVARRSARSATTHTWELGQS